jgi:O-succinylbenzoic acid--CoA ligase
LENQSFDFFAFVPLQFQKLLENEKNIEILNASKSIIVGGAAVNEVLENEIQKLYVPVFSTYGMTETVSHIAIRRLNGDKNNGTFQILEGVKIDIDDRNCLNIISESSNNELIQTNDIVEIVSQKEFKLIGRFDNIINSGGVKIQLERVEKLIEKEIKLLNPKRYFAYGVSDEKLGQKLVLFVEGEEVNNEIKAAFFKNIQSIVSKYEVPKEIYFVKKFIETPTGKVDKKAIISIYFV